MAFAIFMLMVSYSILIVLIDYISSEKYANDINCGEIKDIYSKDEDHLMDNAFKDWYSYYGDLNQHIGTTMSGVLQCFCT